MDSAEFYDEYAKKGFAQVDSEKIMELAKHFLKSPVLDLGCYFGEKTIALSKFFETVEGCDISKTAAAEAKKRHSSLNFFVCDFEKKGAKLQKKYNSVFAVEVIEHVLDTQQFLKNCYDCLNKGGVLFLTAPNAIQLLNRVRLLFGDGTGAFGDTAHIRYFKHKTLKEELEKAGFRLKYLGGLNVKPFLKPIPMPLTFYEGIVAVAEK